MAEARKGTVVRRMSRKETIRYIDGMAREVFARNLEEAERSGAVRRLEILVSSWCRRPR